LPQSGLTLYTDQAEVLEQFDAADPAGKKRMLGEGQP